MPDNRRSKRLSYWLRHAPEAAHLILDRHGWAPTHRVLEALHATGLATTPTELELLVAESDKQRFELSDDKSRIRARQGHSIEVAGNWPEASPPEYLYHGTTPRFLAAIMEQGLIAGRRHHVHLSSTIESARAVGARRGPPILLRVAAAKMSGAGFTFRLSSNGVWLTDHVPPVYLEQLATERVESLRHG